MTDPARLRRRISKTVGFEVPLDVPAIQVLDRAEQDDFVRLQLCYEVPDGETVAAYLLVPNDGGPHPGIVAFHQHNSQWGFGKSEVCGVSGDPLQAFGPALAQHGICVLAPDAVGFESRCLFLAALDTRVGFSCASGAACTYQTKMKQGTGLAMSIVVPGCTRVFDVDDLVRCVAPRRILIVSSEDDPYTEDAHEIVQSALATFEQQDRADHLSHFHGSGPHALDQARYDAIVEWLHTESMRQAVD